MSLEQKINDAILDFGTLHQMEVADKDTNVVVVGGAVPSVAKMRDAIYSRIAAGWAGNSTSLNTVDVGLKTFQLPPNKNYVPGQWVLAVSAEGSVAGPVLSLASNVLTIDAKVVTGAGSSSLWSINLAGLSTFSASNDGEVPEKLINVFDWE